MKLENRVTIVTGSTSGIGRAIAIAFAQDGAKVVVNSNETRDSEEVIAAIRKAGGEAIFVTADVSQSDQVKAMTEKTIQVFGRLDVLVNNAAWGHWGGKPAHELPEAEWNRVLDVCLKGAFLCAKHAIPEMVKAGGGVIINIGSVTALQGFKSETAYMSAKGGLVQLTRALAMDYAPQHIRVNIIHPGFVATPMNAKLREDPAFMEAALEKPLIKRPGNPEEIAQLAVYLASDDSAFITGTGFVIDGGWSVY